MYEFFYHPRWYAIALAGALCLTQGTWLFVDARRRGKSPWLWGLWGLTTVPMPFVLYYYLVVKPDRKL